MSELNPIDPKLIKKVISESEQGQKTYRFDENGKVILEGGLEDRSYRFDPKTGKLVGKSGEDVGAKSSREQEEEAKRAEFTQKLAELMQVEDEPGMLLKHISKKHGLEAGLLFKKWVQQGGSGGAAAKAARASKQREAVEILLREFYRWAKEITPQQ